jgi:hypothetical protein
MMRRTVWEAFRAGLEPFAEDADLAPIPLSESERLALAALNAAIACGQWPPKPSDES